MWSRAVRRPVGPDCDVGARLGLSAAALRLHPRIRGQLIQRWSSLAQYAHPPGRAPAYFVLDSSVGSLSKEYDPTMYLTCFWNFSRTVRDVGVCSGTGAGGGLMVVGGGMMGGFKLYVEAAFRRCAICLSSPQPWGTIPRISMLLLIKSKRAPRPCRHNSFRCTCDCEYGVPSRLFAAWITREVYAERVSLGPNEMFCRSWYSCRAW